jgi:ketosteroid isomerase-like protein
MNRRLWIALAFAGAAALTYVLLGRPGDEERIRRQVSALASAVGIDAGERNAAVRPLRIQQTFRHVFTRSVQVDVPDLVEDAHGRDELAGMAVSAAQTFRDLTLDFSEVRVEIDRPARRALVSAVATLAGTDYDGSPQRAVRDLTLRLEERDGEWRITSIATR